LNDAVDSVQERMERTAVLNARMLVEKMEQERRMKIGFRGWVVVTLLAIALVAIIWTVTLNYNHRLAAERAAMRAAASAPVVDTAAMSAEAYVKHALARVERDGNQGVHAGWRAEARGSAVLDVALGMGGYAKVTTFTSSGDTTLDSRFMTLMKQAEPYGKLPAGLVRYRFRAKLWVDPADRLLKSEPASPLAPG